MILSLAGQAQLGGREWETGLSDPFLKIKKSNLILKKKQPDFVHLSVKFSIQNVVLRVSRRKNSNFVHLWVKFSIQNVVLRVSRRKSSKNFPCEAFFIVFLTKCLLKCTNSTNPSLP